MESKGKNMTSLRNQESRIKNECERGGEKKEKKKG